MCGITGFCDFNKSSVTNDVDVMTNSLAHRGPDDSGTEIFDLPDYTIALGHRRLSIIDTSSAGHQPMFSACNQYCIIFNGEIYNYKELRKQLILKGTAFTTNTDTEVLLQMYQKYGASFIKEVIGMFAIVIYDMRAQQILVFRDRVGVKPLYYYWKDGLLLFGSELKALVAHSQFKKEINNNALAEYFKYGYIGDKNSIYQSVHKLSKGHSLTLVLQTQKTSITKYWSINKFYELPKLTMSSSELMYELKSQFIKAFKYRMVSDVPVGIFLSGGYDSSLLTSILSKELQEDLTTFTVGFSDNEFNEAPIARKISEILGTTHHEFLCSEEDAQHMVELLPTVYDEPFSDPSAIPTLLICQKAASHVKVVLSADGGDENFAGYNRYVNYYAKIRHFKTKNKIIRSLANSALALTSQKLNSTVKNHLNILGGNYSNFFSDVSSHMSDSDLSNILENYQPNNQEVESNTLKSYDQILLWDMDHYLPDNVLTKIDRASMSMGLESREPLLDHRLLEFAAQLPFEFKLHNGIQKHPIKQLVHKYISPDIIDLPKRGFSPPLNKWINGVFNEEYKSLTSQKYLQDQGIINHEAFQKTISNIKTPYLQDRVKWSMFMFQKWHQKWMN